MARPVRKQERKSVPKSKPFEALGSRAPGRVGGRKGSSPVLRPIKVSKQAPKTKQTVSAAGIFKHRAGKTAAKPKKQRKQRSPSPEETSDIDLSEYHHEGIEEAREAIDANLNLGFINVNESFTQKLAEFRVNNEAFLAKMASMATLFSIPLGEEEVDTTSVRNSKSITQRVKIGDRVAMFKIGIEKESARLRESWKKWEDLTTEFADFAAEVFGPEALGRQEVDEVVHDEEMAKQGFKREMELLDLEYEEWVVESIREIEMLKRKTLDKIKSLEQVLTSTSNREYQQILHAVFTE